MYQSDILQILDSMGLRDAPPEAVVQLFNDDSALAMLERVEAEQDEERFGKFHNIYPEQFRQVGEWKFWPRHLYQKHMEFFRAGKTARARCLMAANRVGKTFGAGGFETACHLTGLYPDWWEGRVYRHPIRAWACGKTNETTRDIVQTCLLGEVEYHGARKLVDGSGIIPHEKIGLGQGQITWKQGVADLIDTIRIRHRSGGWSKLGLKSYQQGRGSFEGTAQHVIWDDEEPPMDVYGEQIIRTATTKGILMLTFTPLEGMSDVVQQFLPSNDFEI